MSEVVLRPRAIPQRGAARSGFSNPSISCWRDVHIKADPARNKPLTPISLWAKAGSAHSCGYAVE
jgi:hypothetical protein